MYVQNENVSGLYCYIEIFSIVRVCVCYTQTITSPYLPEYMYICVCTYICMY